MLLILSATVVLALASSARAPAEYGDVVLNHHSDQAGVRPVVFSHWFHRIRFRCKVCHHELAFEMRAGANDVTMTDLSEGKFCGMCHDNQVAWGLENCDLCHSGMPGGWVLTKHVIWARIWGEKGGERGSEFCNLGRSDL